MDPFLQHRALAASGVRQNKISVPKPQVCRVCDCTDITACIGEDGLPCHWVEPDLCSHCNAKLMAA